MSLHMDLPDCEKRICDSGEIVMVIRFISAEKVEMWVKDVEKHSGQKVDWHHFEGMAIVKGLGNVKKIKEVIEELKFRE